jgi:hypothetical protein
VTLPSQQTKAQSQVAAQEYGQSVKKITDSRPRNVRLDDIYIYKSTKSTYSPDRIGRIIKANVGSFPKTPEESDLFFAELEGLTGYRISAKERTEAHQHLKEANSLRTPAQKLNAALDEAKELKAEREMLSQQASIYADQVASARAEVESVKEQIESVKQQLANHGAGGHQPKRDPTTLRHELEELLQRLARAKADLKDAQEREEQNKEQSKQRLDECVDRLFKVLDEVERHLRLPSIGGALTSDGEDGGIEVAVICECNRRLQVARKAYEEGPINCGHCGTPFRADCVQPPAPSREPDDDEVA